MTLTKPHSRSGLQASVVTDPAHLAGLREEWRALWRKSGHASPFQSPDWLIPWWDIFAPGELRIIAVHDDGELIGLAPLYREEKRLLPIGFSLSDYQDVLIDAAELEAAAGAIAEAIDGMDDVECCEFDDLPPDALALQIGPIGLVRDAGGRRATGWFHAAPG